MVSPHDIHASLVFPVEAPVQMYKLTWVGLHSFPLLFSTLSEIES